MYTTRGLGFTLPRHGLAGGLVIVFLVLSFQYTVKVWQGRQEQRSAILRWQDQILALSQGTNIWEECNYPNPPIMALLLTPLVYLPALACSLTWFYLKAGMAVVAVLWVFRLVETSQRSFPLSGKVLAVLFSLKPILGDLTHGNINLFILLLVVASLAAFYDRRDLLAGLLLALAIACKLTPALFLPYFLWKRSWRTLAGCGLGLVLFYLLIPGLFLGMKDNARYLESWFNTMIRPYVLEGVVTSEHNNQSLPGLVYRLASHNPSFADDRDGYVPRAYHNLADLDRKVLAWLIKGCMALLALLVIWSCRTPTEPREGWRLLAEWSIVVLGMLLFSERTWKHHCVTLLLPFAVIVYYLFACRPGTKMKHFLIGILAVSSLLMLATGTFRSGDDQLGKLAQVYGAYVWSYLLLLAALVVLLRSSPTNARQFRPTQIFPNSP